MKKQLKVKRLLIEFVIVCLCGFILKCEESVLPSNQQNPNQDQNTNHSDIWYQTGLDYINGDYAQGVATDGKYWYFSYTTKLYKTTFDYQVVSINESAIPVSLLESLVGHLYNHIGDIEYFDGKLYVPMEDDDRNRPIVCVYDTTDLSFTGEYYTLDNDEQYHASWVAVDPVTRYFYTAPEFDYTTWISV